MRRVVANEVRTSLPVQQTADMFFANQNAQVISVVLNKQLKPCAAYLLCPTPVEVKSNNSNRWQFLERVQIPLSLTLEHPQMSKDLQITQKWFTSYDIFGP